jgi:Mrp family chromosome partitioning ATPase
MREPSVSSVTRADSIGAKADIDKSSLHIMPIRSFVGDADRLVASPEVSAVVRTLRTKYDLVLIDTPPILAVPDALTLAPLVDDTVLVVNWQKTPRRSVAATVRVLLRANIRVTGIILSKVNLRQFARLSTSEGYYARGYAGSELHWAAGR